MHGVSLQRSIYIYTLDMSSFSSSPIRSMLWNMTPFGGTCVLYLHLQPLTMVCLNASALIEFVFQNLIYGSKIVDNQKILLSKIVGSTVHVSQNSWSLQYTCPKIAGPTVHVSQNSWPYSTRVSK